jgi:hypothetical protein
MSCGNDYPPIDPYFSFNIPQTVSFSLSNTASTNKDTTLIAVGKIDTMNYVRDSSSAYLLHTAEVWQLSLQSSDPSFTLDQLSYVRVLIGADTVAFDTLPPQSAIDTTLVLTKTDITQYMRDTSFTASLLCHLKSVPENPVTITCNMTVIYTSADQNF